MLVLWWVSCDLLVEQRRLNSYFCSGHLRGNVVGTSCQAICVSSTSTEKAGSAIKTLTKFTNLPIC
jgi:hypothetical protein